MVVEKNIRNAVANKKGKPVIPKAKVDEYKQFMKRYREEMNKTFPDIRHFITAILLDPSEYPKLGEEMQIIFDKQMDDNPTREDIDMILDLFLRLGHLIFSIDSSDEFFELICNDLDDCRTTCYGEDEDVTSTQLPGFSAN